MLTHHQLIKGDFLWMVIYMERLDRQVKDGFGIQGIRTIQQTSPRR